MGGLFWTTINHRANMCSTSAPRQPYDQGKALSSATAVRMMHLEELNEDNVSTVQCSMVEVKLDECFGYQALSYVWGEDTPSSHILVNGKAVAVTANREDHYCGRLRNRDHSSSTLKICCYPSHYPI